MAGIKAFDLANLFIQLQFLGTEFGGDLDQEFHDLVASGLVFPQVAPTGQAQALVVLHPGGDDHFHGTV